MIVATDKPCTTRWHKRWLSRLLILTLALAGVVVLYRYLTSSQRLSALVVSALEENLGGRVHVGQAEFALLGPVVLQDVTLDLGPGATTAQRMLHVNEVRIAHNPWGLLKLAFSPTKVELHGVKLYLTEEEHNGRYTWQSLLESTERGGKTSGGRVLPEIVVHDAQLLVGAVAQGRYGLRGIVPVAGALKERDDQPGTYGFELHETAAARTSAQRIRIEGRFRGRDGAFAAQVRGLAFDNPVKNLLPGKLQAWWDKAQPEGEVTGLEIAFVPGNQGQGSGAKGQAEENQQGQGGWTARVTGQNLAATVAMKRGDLRMHARTAQVAWQAGALEIEDVTGRTEGIDYRLRGRLTDEADGLRMDLQVQASGPTPTDAKVLALLPTPARANLERFQITGPFNLDVRLVGQVQGKSRALGVIQLERGTASDRRHPYPLHNVRGTLKLDERGAELAEVTGEGRTGGKFRLRGWLRPIENGAGEIVAQIDDLPVDEVLKQSLSLRQVRVVETLLSAPAEARLRGLKLLRPADAPATTTAPDAVPCALGGKLNVTIHNQRAAGENQKWITQLVLTPGDKQGVTVLPEFWPYPMRVTGGRVIIEEHDEVRLEDVRLEGLTGGRMEISGRILPDPAQPERFTPELKLRATGVLVDGLLRASLPEHPARWLEALRLTGRFDAGGSIGSNVQGQPDYQISVGLDGGSAKPMDGSFALTDVAARIDLNRQGAEIRKLEARHDQARLALTGAVAWTPLGAVCDATLTAKDFAFDPSLAEMIPPDHPSLASVRELIGRLQPAGLADVEMKLRLDPQGKDTFAVDLQPRKLAWDHNGRRMDMTEMSGRVRAEAGRVTFHKLAGKIGRAGLEVDGEVTSGAAGAAKLSLGMQAEELDDTLTALLPGGVGRTLERMRLHGGVEFKDAQLTWARTERGPAWELRGVTVWRGASALVGVPVTQFAGTIAIQAKQQAGQAQPTLTLTGEASSVRVAGRLLEPMSFVVTNAEESGPEGAGLGGGIPGGLGGGASTGGLLELKKLTGGCYGGKLTGSGRIMPGDKGWYRLNLALTGAALDPVIHPERDKRWRATTQPAAHRPATPVDHEAPTGVLAASLTIEGSTADASDRRGRGELRITGARLYEVPLTMTVLQIINLSWPSSRAFDQAEAKYLIHGDTVRFDLIRFTSPGVEIAGAGVMKLDTLGLSLDLFSRNPGAADLGPLTEAIKLMKDELLSIHVAGTLDKPEASLQSLPGFRKSWREIFGTPGSAPVEPTGR